MARPTKFRRICRMPKVLEFSPTCARKRETVVLTIDEFEAIRLIDREGLSQEACGAQLGVGRTTAQKIYDGARKKLADALVLGLPLKIEGGDVVLCNGRANVCYKKDCVKRNRQRNAQQAKGDQTMKIAVTYENGSIFQHFGHTEQFKLYHVEDGKIVKTELIATNGSGHGALAGVLSALQADVLICGGIGGGAQMALLEAGIRLYGGVTGNADQAVNEFLSGKLDFDPHVHCEHHDHAHGTSAHACGEHGCGHDCGSHEGL